MKLLISVQKSFDRLNESVDDWRNRSENEADFGALSKITRVYNINAIGDVCRGDEVVYVRRIWQRQEINRFGKLANVVVRYELVEGKVIRESYGEKKQQHTFTVQEKKTRAKILVKGRNLYGVGVWRKLWKNENDRIAVLKEKHERGRLARRDKAVRLMYDFNF